MNLAVLMRRIIFEVKKNVIFTVILI